VTGQLEEDLYVSHYAQLLRRNWLLVLAATVLGGLVGAILVLFVLPRQYRAQASVLFDSSTAVSNLNLPANIPGLSGIMQKLNLGAGGSGTSMMALAVGQSQTIRLEIVERLDLVKQFEALGKYDAEQRLKDMTSIHLTETGTMAVQVSISGTPRGLMPTPDDDLGPRK
jgi:uncharacterized protein involved in exopolysaccharide biosynthesis